MENKWISGEGEGGGKARGGAKGQKRKKKWKKEIRGSEWICKKTKYTYCIGHQWGKKNYDAEPLKMDKK